jgi:hypothetical protein
MGTKVGDAGGLTKSSDDLNDRETMVWMDTEFNGMGGELISMGLVDASDRSLYFTLECSNPVPWVKTHVMPGLNAQVISRDAARVRLYRFLRRYKKVRVIANWPDDIRHFCAMLLSSSGSCMVTPPIVFELEMDLGPTAPISWVPHNAIEDARALRQMYLGARVGRST